MMLHKLRFALILVPILATLAIAAGHAAGSRQGQPAAPPPPPSSPSLADRPFGEKWERVVPMPMPELGEGDRSVAWVEGGGLQVRRETAGGVVAWHVVLAHAVDPDPPTIEAIPGTVRFALSYREGRYFVREDLNLLKCVREPKRGLADWPAVALNPDLDAPGGTAGRPDQPPMLRGWHDAAGYLVATSAGPTEDRRDAFIRLAPRRSKVEGSGFTAMAGPQRRANYGEEWMIDDGEMLVAQFTTEALPVLEVGDEAPSLALSTLDGKPLDLSDFRGRHVLIDFWATRCAPCLDELPALRAAHAAHGADPRFAMIGVSLDEQANDPRGLVAERDVRWPQVLAPGGPDDPTVRAFGARSTPAVFLIGPDGKVVATGLRGDAIGRAVAKALGKK